MTDYEVDHTLTIGETYDVDCPYCGDPDGVLLAVCDECKAELERSNAEESRRHD